MSGWVLRNGVLAVLAFGLRGGAAAIGAMPVEPEAGRRCEDYGACISYCWALADDGYDKCIGGCKDQFLATGQ